MSAPKIMIATPTLGYVSTNYMKSVIATMTDLAQHGITSWFDTFENSDLPKQRNILATRFYESDFTHLFFTDSDMMYSFNLCRQLLERNKPMIGTIYPIKFLDLSRIERAIARGFTFAEATTFGHDWLCTLPDEEKLRVQDGLLQVDYLGFGAVLISRYVFDTLIKHGDVRRQVLTKPAWGPFYNFFTMRAQAAAANQSVSEDISFCDRWRIDCGGKIWALVDVPIYHIGDFGYGGVYFDHLKALERKQQQPELADDFTHPPELGQHAPK